MSPEGRRGGRDRLGEVPSLPRPSEEDFRRAARSFRRSTGLGVEALNPRDFNEMGSQCIEAVIDVMMACELLGIMPSLAQLTLVKLIPKRDGGRKPYSVSFRLLATILQYNERTIASMRLKVTAAALSSCSTTKSDRSDVFVRNAPNTNDLIRSTINQREEEENDDSSSSTSSTSIFF